MSLQPVIDTVLGLSFIFFLGALLASGMVEWFANIIRKRARIVLAGLARMLGEDVDARTVTRQQLWQRLSGFSEAARQELTLYEQAVSATSSNRTSVSVAGLLDHGLVKALRQTDRKGNATLPSYIPGDLVAKALFETLRENAGQNPALADVAAAATEQTLKQALSAFATVAGQSIDTFLAQIEKWYDAQMDRANGTYRRWAKRRVVAAAALVVVVFHIDAVAIATDLWTNEPLRTAVAAAAVANTCQPATDGSGTDDVTTCVNDQIKALELEGLPIGPQQWCRTTWDLSLFPLVCGLALSTLAISMGAPFWFSVMNKLVNVRNSGTPPKEAQE